jgi:hypothetical protein
MKYPIIKTNDDNDRFIVWINETRHVSFRINELLLIINDSPQYIVDKTASQVLACINNWQTSKFSHNGSLGAHYRSKGVHPLETEMIHSLRIDRKRSKHPLLYITIDSGVKPCHRYRMRLCQKCLNGEKIKVYDCDHCSRTGISYNRSLLDFQKYIARALKLPLGEAFRVPKHDKKKEMAEEENQRQHQQYLYDQLITAESRIM